MLALMCEAGDGRHALDASCVIEVVPCVRLETTVETPDWLAGAFSYRGRAVFVADLGHLIAATPCPRHLSSRIIVADFRLPDLPSRLGLLVQRVVATQIDATAGNDSDAQGQLSTHGRILLDEQGMYQLIDPARLFPAERRRALRPIESEGRE